MTVLAVLMQGVSRQYDAAVEAVSAARQALDDAAEGERRAFAAAGADAKLVGRICVEDTEEGVVLRVRCCTSCPAVRRLVSQCIARPVNNDHWMKSKLRQSSVHTQLRVVMQQQFYR